jgi:hypothetical protein
MTTRAEELATAEQAVQSASEGLAAAQTALSEARDELAALNRAAAEELAAVEDLDDVRGRARKRAAARVEAEALE